MEFSNEEIKIVDTIPIMTKEDEQNKIIKCLKSYLTGKKYVDNDDEKSLLYFKQCISLLNDIKGRYKLEENILSVIDETETECSKMLSKAIEKNIEKPIIFNPNNDGDSELFDIVDTGDINKLKKFKFGECKFNIYNEEGLTPLHYAIKVGDTAFIKGALKLGASVDQTNMSGHTLLEYACLEKDPNMINFITDCGADMKKHLIFRNGKLFNNKGSYIDILLLEKYIMTVDGNSKIVHLNWIFNYINKDTYIDLEHNESNHKNVKIKMYDLILKLDNLISSFDKNTLDTYLSIIKDELLYELNNKFGCPNNKLEIILYNLVPFLNNIDSCNLKLDWLIRLEFKYIILQILKNKLKINISFLKNELFKNINEKYINTQLMTHTMCQIYISQWLLKIKV